MPDDVAQRDVREIAFRDRPQRFALEIEDGPARTTSRGRPEPGGSGPGGDHRGSAAADRRRCPRVGRRRRSSASSYGPTAAPAWAQDCRTLWATPGAMSLPGTDSEATPSASASRRCTVAVAAPSACASAVKSWPRLRRVDGQPPGVQSAGEELVRHGQFAARGMAVGVPRLGASHSPVTQPRVAGTSNGAPGGQGCTDFHFRVLTLGEHPEELQDRGRLAVVDDHRTVGLLAGEDLHDAGCPRAGRSRTQRGGPKRSRTARCRRGASAPATRR